MDSLRMVIVVVLIIGYTIGVAWLRRAYLCKVYTFRLVNRKSELLGATVGGIALTVLTLEFWYILEGILLLVGVILLIKAKSRDQKQKCIMITAIIMICVFAVAMLCRVDDSDKKTAYVYGVEQADVRDSVGC